MNGFDQLFTELIKKVSKKMVAAIVAMFILYQAEANPIYILLIALVSISWQGVLDYKYGKDKENGDTVTNNVS